MKKIYLVSFISIAVFLCITSNTFAQNLPPGFTINKLAQFDNPVSYTFAKDGRMILLQQTGSVKLYNNGTLINNNLITLDSVYSQKEKGVLGVTFDPNFEANGYIYIYYTVNVSGNIYQGIRLNNTGSPSNPPVRNKIVRYTMSGDEVIRSSKRTILDLDIVPGFVTGVNHDGGALKFGQDGKLYLAVGDGEQWCASVCQTTFSSVCNCGNSGWVTSSTANENNSFHGKILRLNSDGTAPSDNPYYSSPTPVEYHQKYFYAKGFRNPFTMNFKNGTNDLYINDLGSSGAARREEINKITATSIKHYGWQSPGGGEGILGNANYTDPIYAYLNGTSTITGCGIVGGTFYESVTGINTPWPIQYYNKYFFMDFCNGWINMLDINNNNSITNFASNMYSNVNNASSGTGNLYLEMGADGNLYYLTRGVISSVSGLYRISYQPTQVTSVTISGSGNSISVPGGALQFTGGVLPQNASIPKINWIVTPTSFASITQDGLLSAFANGVITVIGKSEANTTIIDKTVITITGQIVATGITITTSGLPLSISSDKGTLALNGQVIPSGALQGINWAIIGSNPATATAIISSNGILSATGANGVVSILGTSQANSSISRTIVVTISGQNETLTGVSISNSQSQKTFSEKHLIVYPNPNSGVFTVELDLVKGKDVTIYVMDQLGNDIYKQDIKNFSGKTQVNLSSIAKGMYRVSVSHGLGSFHQLILVE
ncbi:MAG: T9SS C-terminal target domain-containing protein [Bacteroidetes bacterium]|nr:MAG: T9SS C-terminal target domain-containing protein [Bacteroidota bacterium]